MDQRLSQPLAQPEASMRESGEKARAEMGAMWPSSRTAGAGDGSAGGTAGSALSFWGAGRRSGTDDGGT